jgi:hypothetical protein
MGVETLLLILFMTFGVAFGLNRVEIGRRSRRG